MALTLMTLDLYETSPETPVVPSLFFHTETVEQRTKFLYQQLLRAKRMKNRILLLFYAYRLGELIETIAETLLERALCIRHLSRYYQKVIIRTFYIFESLGEEQIFRSQHMTMAMISRLSHTEYLNIIQVATNIAGERLISLEQDS